MFEALKIYILDILSVLLPGALLLAVLGQSAYLTNLFHSVFSESPTGWINVVVNVSVAYMLGHFVFFTGSFLDDWIFENVRRVFYTNHKLVAYIIAYKAEKTGIKDPDVMNAFKWSCAWLMANKPEMYAAVERFIAESKFFRSLVVVLFISAFVFLYKQLYLLTAITVVLIILSLVRYLTQRQKSIETTYHFIITTSDKVFSQKPDRAIVDDLDKRNIDLPKMPHAAVALKVWMLSMHYNIRKVLAVLNLCFNPFRKTDTHDVQE